MAMELIQCDSTALAKVTAFYHRVIEHLERNVNYPNWSSAHPGDQGIRDAIAAGEQYMCVENGTVLGALVLNENPEGAYDAGAWREKLENGDFLVIHALAVDPSFARRGIGAFMVEQCIGIALQGGYRALRLDVVPGNFPAARLYQKKGFVYAGTRDLQRHIDAVPVFDLYELIL